MNYWLTGPSNLAECFLPFAEWVDSIREVRKEETRRVFGIEEGWLMRSENNLFGGSTWHVQKGDSAWLCQNLWDHYAFTRDREYLEKKAYPIMKEISRFWVQHLKELPDGTLVAPDGRSPEHGPVDVDGVTYDQQLCWDLFSNVIEASEVLGVDAAYREELRSKRERLLGPQVGRWGQLQEWMEDIDDPKDQHRHVNHLIGLYPGRQISPTLTPKFAKAAQVSLDARGHGPTGWSKAWKISMFARLFDAQSAYEILSDLIASKTYGNLWMTHPPFQIDANFGYAAGLNEMLLQSQTGEIHLLPAVPKKWSEGRVRGIRARGDFEVDLQWKEGRLVAGAIRAGQRSPSEVTVRLGSETTRLALRPGEEKPLKPGAF
jgi:alpha-L-fucosidase 2